MGRSQIERLSFWSAIRSSSLELPNPARYQGLFVSFRYMVSNWLAADDLLLSVP